MEFYLEPFNIQINYAFIWSGSDDQGVCVCQVGQGKSACYHRYAPATMTHECASSKQLKDWVASERRAALPVLQQNKGLFSLISFPDARRPGREKVRRNQTRHFVKEKVGVVACWPAALASCTTQTGIKIRARLCLFGFVMSLSCDPLPGPWFLLFLYALGFRWLFSEHARGVPAL